MAHSTGLAHSTGSAHSTGVAKAEAVATCLEPVVATATVDNVEAKSNFDEEDLMFGALILVGALYRTGALI